MQGGMANITTGEFAATVSNAGALGIIASGGMSVDELRDNIKKAKDITDKPFGVNLMLMNPKIDEMAKLLIEEKVPVVTTGAGNPGKYIESWKAEGIKVIPVVASVALAKRMEKIGADAIIAEGTESGGHVGETTSLVLIPQIADSVNIPVIAAGGIASGKQMLASEVLGACGVQIGTAMLLTRECPIHQNYKDEIKKAKDSQITVMGRIGGAPVRVVKNEMSKNYVKLEKEGASLMELEKYTLGSLRKAVNDGDVVNGSIMAGQVAAMLDSEYSIEELLEKLMTEYSALRKGF